MEHIKTNWEIDTLRLKANKKAIRVILANLAHAKTIITLDWTDLENCIDTDDMSDFEF